jgi:hypothetical protein
MKNEGSSKKKRCIALIARAESFTKASCTASGCKSFSSRNV